MESTKPRHRDPRKSEYVTPAEAAEILGCSRKTIYNLIHRHEIPAVKIGTYWRLSIKPYLNAMEGGGAR